MGKSYVCSDIHGMKGSYQELLEKLNEDDILYILGDATDRGKDGIDILFDIKKHVEGELKPKIEYILGNHDLMLIENMETIMKHNLTRQSLDNFQLFYDKCFEYMQAKFSGRTGNETLQCMRENCKWLKNVSDGEILILAEHIYNNGLRALLKFCSLDKEEQKNLYSFLENSPVQKSVVVNNQKFMLTHAAPVPEIADSKRTFSLRNMRNAIKIDVPNVVKDRKAIMKYMAARDEVAEKYWWLVKQKGFLTISGHTPSVGKIKYYDEYRSLVIDTCCSSYTGKGTLAVVCLDDGELQMIGPKGRIEGKEFDSEPEDYEWQKTRLKRIFNSLEQGDSKMDFGDNVDK